MSTTIGNGLEPARGYFNRVEYIDGRLVVDGWLLVPGKRIDKTIFSVGNRIVREFEIIENMEVAKVFDFIPDSKYSGFSISEEMEIPSHEMVEISIVALQDGRQIGHLKTCYCKEAAGKLIDRDRHLMQRVAHTESVAYFRASAFKSFFDFWTPASKHVGPSGIKKVLDWGCGCGRLVEVFEHLAPDCELYGCDIDSEAIAWCKKHLGNIKFDVISPLPPALYPDNFFDIVVGNSVFTHLTRDVQYRWLEELNRIIKKGGLLLATVHGEFATFFQFRDKAKGILSSGIHDGSIDNTLGDIAPKGYYRGTYQSRQYTEREFGKYFDIVEYIERGSLNFQDIVVMRKKEL